MAGPLVIVTVAVPDWFRPRNSWRQCRSGRTRARTAGAVYSPVESMEPHAPGSPHPAPRHRPDYQLVISARHARGESLLPRAGQRHASRLNADDNVGEDRDARRGALVAACLARWP